MDRSESDATVTSRVAERVFGDPSRLPRRFGMAVVFFLCVVVAGGGLLAMRHGLETSGSLSAAHPVLRWLTSIWILIPVSLFLFRSVLFFRRSRIAAMAADELAWLPQSVAHLADEIKTTDGCTRVMVTSTDSYEYIEERIDSALDGGEDDLVDFSEPVPEETADEDSFFDATPSDAPDVFVEYGSAGQRERRDAESVALKGLRTNDISEALSAAQRAAAGVEGHLSIADPQWNEVSVESEGVTRDEPEGVVGHTRRYASRTVNWIVSGVQRTASSVASTIGVGMSLLLTVLMYATSPIWFPLSMLFPESDRGSYEDDRDVSWWVRLQEEIKHLSLDIQSGWRKTELLVKLVVPAAVTLVALLLPFGIWVPLHVFVLFVGVSLLVGITFFAVSKRRLQRRLRHHRQEREFDFWQDVAGQFKTVETPDQTCYMGFIGGRRYAGYDREEFVSKTAKVMWQLANGHHVHPTILEHNARSIAQYRPLLGSYLENYEKPEIAYELRNTVLDEPEEIITRADLAYQVCEPGGRFYEYDLGHDPEIVAEVYAEMVRWCQFDEEHVVYKLPDGDEVEVTLVFPSDKGRRVEADVLHSEFNERFLTSWGDPIYPLPDVDPTDDVQPFVPTPEASEQFPDTAPELPSGEA